MACNSGMTLVTVLSSAEFPVQFKGSALARRVLQLFGWQYVFSGLPSQQGVIIGYPHTSNWDFIVMVLVKWATGLQVQFLAKKSLFDVPLFSAWLRQLGGIPIDRSSKHGVVGDMLSLFAKAKEEGAYLWLALSPEGTRKFTPGWRSGFYQVALQADVPLCAVRIDYGQKTVDFSHCMRLTGNEESDYRELAQAFEGVKGFHVHQAAPIQPMKSTPTLGPTRTP
jgi:1-acyl-sn-glycerol-3-phosphate acyltransferase